MRSVPLALLVLIASVSTAAAQFLVNGGNADTQLMSAGGFGPGSRSGPVLPPFLPSELSGLVIWLDGNTQVLNSGGTPATDGQNVGTWTNRVAGPNCTASSNFPTYAANVANGNAAVRFNGTSAGLTCAVGFASAPYTVITARKRTAAGAFQTLIAETSGATTGFGSIGADNSSPAPFWYVGATGVSNHNTNLTEPLGTFAITSAWGLGGSPPNELGLGSLTGFTKVNGVLGNVTSQTVVGQFGSNIWVGRDAGGDYFGGDMAELLIFNRYLSDYEVFQVERYLAAKYAIFTWFSRPPYSAETFDGWVTQGIAIAPGPTAWDAGGVNGATFAYVDGTYYAAYTGQNAGPAAFNQIGCASGPSLDHLTKFAGNPCLTPTAATWDVGYVSGSRLFVDPVTGNVYLYYFASTTGGFEGGPSSIGVAQVNLSNFAMTKFAGNPILTPGAAGSWDAVSLFKPWIYYNPANLTYYLFYNASGPTTTTERSGYATAPSPTGPFTKFAGNPIMSDQIMTGRAPSGFTRMGNPEVIQPDPNVDYWVMFALGHFAGVCECTFLAYSTDLATWTPARQANPFEFMRFPQVASPGTFPTVRIGGIDPHLVNGQWQSLVDDDRVTQGISGSIYWQTLVHESISQAVITGFTATGPSTAVVSLPSTNFTIFAIDGAFTGLQTVTISDGGAGGTITPSVGSPGTSSVTVTPVADAFGFTFTYTPASLGAKTLTFTNAQGWPNPAPLSFAANPQSFTATGPSLGFTGVPSTDFTVALAAGTFNGSQTITIDDGLAGGTITPSVGSPGVAPLTVTPAASATGFTFAYTSSTDGPKTLTFTNAQSWTNPSPLPYTSLTSYTGPGDVVSGAVAWYGISCYSRNYTGLVADITDTATGNTTGTRLQCFAGVVSEVVSASACSFVAGNACSPLATTCATSCNVARLYDQSGFNNCGGGHPVPCDLGSFSNSARPLLALTAISGKPAINCTGSSSMDSRISGAGFTTSALQPFTISAVTERLSGSAVNFPTVFSAFSATRGLFFGTSASATMVMYTGSALPTAVANDNIAHAAQGIFNGASSIFYIDGVQTPGLALGNTNGFVGTQVMICNIQNNTQPLTGYIGEVGIWPVGFTTLQQSTMNSTQHGRWAF